MALLSKQPSQSTRGQSGNRKGSPGTIRKLFFYFSLFQYSTKCERIFIALAIFLAVLSACIPPAVNVLYGEFCNMLIDRQFPSDSSSTKTAILAWFGGGRILRNASREERREALEEDSKAWGIGCGSFTLLQFILSFASVSLLCIAASRQMCRIKILFFKSAICKDMTWFDSQIDGDFVGRASENLFLIERGIADLLSVITFQLVVGVINIVICFLRSWILSLILLMVIIPVIVSVIIKLKFQSRLSQGEMQHFAKAGSVAEEAFASIRTVVAFGGEEKEADRYLEHLKESKANGIRRGIVTGISSGIMWFIIYSSYATAFFLGTRLVLTSRTNDDHKFTPADLIIVLFGMLTGLTNFGYAAGHFETMSVACAAAASVFKVINTKATIDPCLNAGRILIPCKGEIEFRDVHFDYPSRPSVKILKGVNLKIKPGERVAIVGGSGAGKSTILQLLQRLYDPSQGEVLLDGNNIKSLRVSWLRGQMGVVSQEPLLFATTIRENISFGYPPATEKDIEEAARVANAHSFIVSLKDKYNTVVGQRGSTLSGGQKQRIAIARALVRKPKILLLDEATSALDAVNEKLVQEALDKASTGRTTLIVTHRLSTITNVDRIVVLDNGSLAEEGTHDELVRINGIYKKLLNSQRENIAENKRRKIEIPKTSVIYEEEAVFPPGRFSSPSIYGSHTKTLEFPSLERLERFKKSSYVDIIKWSKPERLYLVCGSVASVIGGTALPAVCVLLGSLCGLFASRDDKFILDRTDLYTSLLVAIGIVSGLCIFLQMYCFSVAALQLSTRIRVKYFQCMIRQEIPWFEHEENKVGVLCLRLSQDASEMQRAVGTHFGILLQALSTLMFGTILSFFFNWKITLVTLFTIPFVFAGVYIETIFTGGFGDVRGKSSEKASRIAVEVINNIKAVSSLGNEWYFIEKYTTATKEVKKLNMLRACLRGLAFAIGQTVPFFGYSIALWFGGLLVARENLHYQYVIMVTEILIFGAWTLGQSVVFTPNIRETKAAVGRLKYIFLRKSRIPDGEISSDPKFDSESYVRYSKVGFSYPVDPEAEVLRNFNMVVKSGESVAIMGPSGSGKSTVIQLLLRFYTPNYGAIYINNVNIEEYKLSSLRKLLGLVSQEPTLFNRTIKENIAYGDNSREVPLDEIIEAAEAANIHGFIQSLPFGYDTTLGTGTQLSGGQKQRIAIARVLVRKPQIILLDEATSALDPESEGIVQDALDNLSTDRTTITVAHRLSATRNADVIYVMGKGSVTESGTHQDLIKLKGKYYAMYSEGNDS